MIGGISNERRRSTTMIKNLLLALAAMIVGATAYAQVEPAVKESAKAVAESTKEAGDKAKAATASEPNKSIDKSKAQVHKAKAHAHKHQAKKAADTIAH
jgi:ribosomal protein L10